MSGIPSDKPLWDAFRNAARTYSSRAAVSTHAETWSYDRLFQEADGNRKWLESEIDDGPVLFAPRNTASSLAFLLGATGSGKVPLFADPAWQAPELEGIIARCGVRAAAWEGPVPPGLLTLTPAAERSGIQLFKFAAGEGSVVPRKDTSFGRFTSGTTGFSRCLQFRDEATLKATATWREAAAICSGDRVLCLATLNNGLAFNTSIFTVLLSGGMLAFHSGMLVRGALFRTLARVEPTVLVAFPFVYELLESGKEPIAASALRLAVSSAAPLPEKTRAKWLQDTGLPICNYYGLAEVGPCTFNDGSDPDCVGVPLPGVSIAVTAEDGRAVEPGKTGQIRVKTESMASAYLDACQPEFQVNLDTEQYYITNDLGLLTPDDRLRLRGRIGRLVNIAGRKIDPGEVEKVIRQIQGVEHVTVRGEEQSGRPYLAAYVESKVVKREQIVEFCESNLAQYKIPQRIVVLQDMPRSSAGKISLGRVSVMEGVSR